MLIERLAFDPSKTVRNYSSGNKRELGLILALMHQPELLIFDEPTNGLDPLMQQTFYQLVREAQARGATIFLSSHILSEVQTICERVASLREGRLCAVERVAVYLGVCVTIDDEERGTLDVLLSAPVTRTQVVIERLLAFAVSIALSVLIGHLSLTSMVVLFESFRQTVDQARLSQGSLNMLPSAWFVLALTAALGAVVRRRGTAATLGGAVVAGSFFVDTSDGMCQMWTACAPSRS
jgi:energy-coupling factor transporter ATP-binding protein EcfA2